MIGQTLALKGLTKRYENAVAVDGVSLVIRAGEFLSILGPSGSGKTTLLTMIAGFENPSSGQIMIGPQDVTYMAPNKRNIGMVFQRYALFPHLTVAANIAFPLRMRHMSENLIRPKVEAALAQVHLGGYADRYPHQLSGGQQQRVAVARAIIFEPPVLLMDEPLGALDKKLRETLQLEIKSLQQRLGATVVYVTHDQEEAMTMSDRVAVVANGRLAQVGSPLELYRSPVSAFVGDFIGRMNFLEAEYLGLENGNHMVRLRGGNLVSAAPADEEVSPFSLGQAISVAVRPERLSLAPHGRDRGAILTGTVDAAVFAGSFFFFFVRTQTGNDRLLQIQMPVGHAAASLRRGDLVDAIAESNALRLFAKTEA
ncbi:ABC transporter ATP-binding protein [Rhizobium sp. BR 362]|uniref:ABC transporter ATP-binding protein n=1 Tax=Rhizobium sp. BR 362 TaxID=3040670 RepID=UPI002F42CDD0